MDDVHPLSLKSTTDWWCSSRKCQQVEICLDHRSTLETHQRENIGFDPSRMGMFSHPNLHKLHRLPHPRQNVFKLTSYSSNCLVSDSKKLFMSWGSLAIGGGKCL